MALLNEIKNKAIEYLARREHSHHELKQKLAQKFKDSEELVDQALQELADKKLQSDQRFVEIMARHRARAGYGLIRIKQELIEHNIDSETLSQVLESLEIDWTEMAQNLYQKKYGNKPIENFEDKMKRSRYLYSHGFSQEEIKACLNGE